MAITDLFSAVLAQFVNCSVNIDFALDFYLLTFILVFLIQVQATEGRKNQSFFLPYIHTLYKPSGDQGVYIVC